MRDEAMGVRRVMLRATGCIPPIAMPLSRSLSLPQTDTRTQTHLRTKALLAF